MPRKSTITRLPPKQRAFVEKLLREDRLTLDEMIAEIRKKFPSTDVSRSSLHRYQVPVLQATQRMREIETAARIITSELGENADDRSGALMVQLLTTALNDAALKMQERDDTNIEELRKLARAVKDTIGARGASLRERVAVKQQAREEAAQQVSEAAREVGLTDATIELIRERVLRGGA